MPRHTSSPPLTPPPLSPLFDATNERLALDASQIEQLQRYVETLGKWQPTLNLIGTKTWADVWNRHVVDSLQCLDPAGLLVGKAMSAADQAPKTLADIGTGAGFPGIVIAIATGLPVTLVESDQRKAAFLLAVKSATGAPLTIVAKRVEALPAQPLDVLFARAFAPLPRLLEWCAPLIGSKTTLVLQKGRAAAAEISAAQRTHHFESESFPSVIDGDSVILRLRNVRPAR